LKAPGFAGGWLLIETQAIIMAAPKTNYDLYVNEPNNEDVSSVPGDQGKFVVGHAHRYLVDPLPYLQDMYKKYGPVSRLNTFGRMSVAVVGPDDVQKVLLDKNKDFSSKMGFLDRLGIFFTGSLIMEDFETHKFQRRIFQTAFKNDMLKHYTNEINGIYDRALTDWEKDDGKTIESFEAVKDLLLEVAAEIFIGEKERGDTVTRLNKAFQDTVNGAMFIFPVNLPGFTYYRGLEGKKYLQNYIGDLVPKKRATEGKDMMSLFCKEVDEDGNLFPVDEITNQTIFLLFAAHDTTTAAITHSIYFLAQHPEIKERLYQECKALGKDHLEYEDLNEMPYMQMVFNETQRARPSVPLVPRRSVRDVEMPCGVTIPAHTMTYVFPRFNHWMDEYWTEPEKFDPERFNDERKEQKAHPFLFHPFGGGAHKCIGMHFAQMEYKCFIYQFLLKYDFESTHKGGQLPKMQTFPLPKPKNNMPIRLMKR
jgi:cytochrome P450